MRRLIVLCTAVATTVALAPDVAQAAPQAAGPRPVTHVGITSLSSTSVTLAWRVPRSYGGAEVRLVHGTRTPTTPTSGLHAARVTAAHRSVTLRHLVPGSRYSVSVFALDAHGHAARRAAVLVTTAPGAVTDLRTYLAAQDTLVRWTLPRDHALAKVVVRYAEGKVAPATRTSGHGVRLPSPRSGFARLGALRKNTTYAVSVFTLDRASHTSAPSVTRFTTIADPAHDGVVTGRVTDAAGHPLLNADVIAGDYYGFGGVPGSRRTTTGADGRYTLALPPGDWDLVIGGQQILGGSSDASGYQVGFGSATVKSGATADAGNTKLAAGAAVRGRVIDPAGTPVAGATVSVTDVSNYVDVSSGSSGTFGLFFAGGEATPAVTASDGSYTLRGLPAGGALRVCATRHPSDDTQRCGRSSVEPGIGAVRATGDLTLPTESGSALRGRLHAAARGLGAAEIDIEPAEGSDADSNAFAETTTRSDGTFDVDGLPAGRYAVCSSPYDLPGTTGYTAVCATATVAAARDNSVDLAARTGSAISGVVTGPGGHPVEYAYVSGANGGGNGAVTDSRGRYRVTALSRDPQVLCVSSPSGPLPGAPTGVQGTCQSKAHAVTVRVGTTRANIGFRLAPGGAISGTARDSHGAPVADALVLVNSLSVGDEDVDSDSEGTTDDSGRYTVAGLAAGRYQLCVVDFGGGTAAPAVTSACRHSAVTVRVGATTRTDVAFPVRASITVTVTDADGAPVAGVDASALTECPDDPEFGDDCSPVALVNPTQHLGAVAAAVTDDAGTAALRGLPAGRYAVCAFAYYATTAAGGSPTGYADRCTGSTLGVVVATGASVAVHLTLAPGGAVSGRITDPAGDPLGGVRLAIAQSGVTDYPGAPDPADGVDDEQDGTLQPAYDVTAPDGTYSVIGIVPGARAVCALAQDATGGPAGAGYLDECVGGKPGDVTKAKPVTITSAAVTPGVDLALTPGAALSGSLRDPSGHAITDSEVLVFPGRSATGIAYGAGVQDDGTWRSPTIVPGSYTVCELSYGFAAQCWRRVAWPDSDRFPPLARATLVTAGAGAVITGIDFRPAPAPGDGSGDPTDYLRTVRH